MEEYTTKKDLGEFRKEIKEEFSQHTAKLIEESRRHTAILLEDSKKNFGFVIDQQQDLRRELTQKIDSSVGSAKKELAQKIDSSAGDLRKEIKLVHEEIIAHRDNTEIHVKQARKPRRIK